MQWLWRLSGTFDAWIVAQAGGVENGPPGGDGQRMDEGFTLILKHKFFRNYRY